MPHFFVCTELSFARKAHCHNSNCPHSQQGSQRCLLPAASWNPILGQCGSGVHSEESHATRSVTALTAYTLAVYLNYILRDEDVCLVCILIRRNGSCNRTFIKEGPYNMCPYMQLENFIWLEINAFCIKRTSFLFF